MSKGSKQRPSQVDEAIVLANWDRIFKKNKPYEDKFYPSGIRIPQRHGRTVEEWQALGVYGIKEQDAYYKREQEEKRMDIIGSNGNTGEHYNCTN
jgi:hypothetical protein